MTHAYYESYLLLGKLLRGARYSTTHIVDNNRTLEVHKRRAAYAPLLVALGDPVAELLNAGIVVLSQAEWERRERLLYERLYGMTTRVERDGTLVLPYLPGKTLATLLADSSLGTEARAKAIALSARALADLHAKGFTHADAMAENVMIDLEAGVARWFDFETVHDAGRDETWRRADDVRALIATCLLRTPSADYGVTLDHILDSYRDKTVLPVIAASFSSTTHRVLVFHLGQAPLSYDSFQEIGRLLNQRLTAT
jgi:serine/threonine protein kinase